MEEEEDTDSEEVEEYSGMEQPPLIKQLKGILAEYPDDGQIIKELIQNAEDAGATEMKILYDGRTINKQMSKKIPYRKFFMGPALCFYNNEVFTDNDWHGIRMIYSSVKEEDPLKVGRFGLGFKSVFHITDHPCIISGQRLLLMNPHEKNPDKVCITIKLANLEKCRRLDIQDFAAAFDGTCGFSVDCLNTGSFSGTLFWFPLRETPSNLSDTTYDGSKIMDLFKSFQTEAVDTLLFLKSLCKVELQFRDSTAICDLPDGQPFFVVELEDPTAEVKDRRKTFLKQIKDTRNKATSANIISVTTPKFKTRLRRTEIFQEVGESSWVIVNMFKAGKMSNKLKSLVQDKDLSYSPFVGVAAPLEAPSGEFKGHIFCFLPLPQEKKSLTGLPVHVNGFFAMSQNRRHLKWASADQETYHMHRDKAIEWNECLVNEVLPEAYICLINELIVVCQNRGNSMDTVKTVYSCIPALSKVNDKWQQCVRHLHKNLVQTKLVFIKKHDKWTKPSEPLYTMFDRQNVSQTTKDSVTKVLQFYPNIEDTHVPDHIWEFLKDLAKPRDVSPLEVAKILKTEDNYSENLTQDERLNILDYILKNQKFSVLQGLNLLPMEDGSFNIFRQKGSGTLPVYMCTKEESHLFPGLENKLVSTQMPEKLRNILLQLSKQGTYQIEVLTVHTVAQLLSEVAQNHFGDKDPVVVSFTGHNQKLSDWMEHVWDFIMKCPSEKLLNFAHIPLLPSLQNGSWLDASWKNTKLLLYKLTNVFVVKLNEDMQYISESIYDALTHLSVTVLNSLPPWINADKLPCVYYLTPSGIPRLLDRLSEIGTLGIVSFNTSCKASEREAFVNVISHCRKYFKRGSINYLKKLNLFQFKASLKECSQKYTCITSDSRIANISPDFPIRLPQPMLVASSENSLLLACTLGAKEINIDQMVLLVLEAISNYAYSRSEVDTFMKWFLEHMDQYKTQNKVMTIASTIAFVPSENGLFKPSELYDSKDNFLKALFFGEENKFPVKDYTSDIYLHGLKKLGLNTRKNVLAGCLYTTATVLDETFRDGETNLDVLQKAKALFVYFEENAGILESFVEETGAKLHSSIRLLRCIPQRKDRPKQYPKEMPWEGSTYTLCSPNELKGITFANIVGSVQALVKYKSKKFGELFQWHSLPDLSVLTSHLKVIQSCYTSSNKPQFLPLISDTFKAMAEMTLNLNSDGKKQMLLQEHAVWWGDGFCPPKKIVLETRKGDIDLKPYMYTLPVELQGIKSFFGEIGCRQVQNERVLLDVLGTIARYHEKNTEVKKHRVRKDLNLVLQILNKLFEVKLDINDAGEGLLFPIHTDSETQLILKPCHKCIYCDAKWLLDVTTESCEDEEIYYIHGEVPAHISEGLGVRSVRQHLMSDTEGLAEWGQEEPLTRRLHNLLKEGYTDGLSVPKELIQNADDAGATDCFFIYDERQNMDARTHLLDDDMADWQGPALWAYNNGIFSEDDLRNITKLSGATKETDTTKIGKFGLGFCAVYNLTDVPSFVSGKNLVMFDPHMTFLGKVLPGKSPGLRIDLQRMKNVRMLKRLTNQFKPFQDVLGCDLSVSKKELFFPGTLFRFPLRTQKHANTSLIKKLCYSKDEVLKLLKQFAEASGNMLLFTQRLENIKVLHIPESGVLPSKAEALITVSKETVNKFLDKSVLELCTEMKQNAILNEKPYEGLQQINISVKCIETVELLSDIKCRLSNTSWLVSWATGSARSLQLCNSMNMKGLLPLGGVAMLTATESDMLLPKSLRSVPFGFYDTGHIFCYLPLPEKTHLQVHINGSFAVTSERRSLQSDTEDDKYKYASDWNDALLEDAIVNAFIHLLICIRAEKSSGFQPLSPDYTFYKFWPVSTRKCPKITTFISGFYRSVIQNNIPLLSCDDTWMGVRSCSFLEKSLRYDSTIGEFALSTLQKFNRNDEVFIVDLPLTYFDEFQKISEWKDNCHIVTNETFFKDYFLTNINDEYWDKKERTKIRNALLLYCLEHSTCAINETLTLTDCIPTKPNGILRKPEELVHPNGELVHLFSIEDNRFPEKNFSSYSILSKLCSLGMMKSKLNPNLLVDRVLTVQKLAVEVNHTKALERCKHLVEYLGGCDEIAEDELSEIRTISFLPILAKPKTWPFSWKSNCIVEANETSLNTDCFENPSHLFTFDCFELVACVQPIFDTDSLRIKHNQKEIFDRLGVKTFKDVSLEHVVQQLLTICRDETEEQLIISMDIVHTHAKNVILERIYKFLNDILLEEPEKAENVRSLLANKPVIYLNNTFLPPNKVAFSIAEDCSPELYGIGQHRINKYCEFLKAIGVREHFEICDVVEVLKRKKLKYCEAIIPPEEVRLTCRLLHCLTDLMKKSLLVYSSLEKCLIEYIVAPDTCCVLTPTYMLCFDDCDFVQASDNMKFIHADISRTVANILGVLTKRNKHIDSCSVEIPFEQKEELLTRLKGLLDGYPCDSGIMKELIQNADDANASEIHFVKDYRQHGVKTIFTDSFVEFQGPALCVFNDSFFTQEDFAGIQRLGMGSKSNDPAKTGQYGVGFNAVYNLTDLPTFLTKGPGIDGGETLCIFDPLHKHSSERIGTRYVDMKAIRSTYPDVISGYNEKMFFSDSTYKGTVFRFPLRQTESAISDKIITEDTLDDIIETFKKDMPEMLIFLKHLTKITVSKITENGIKTEWTVSMNLTEHDADRRSAFSNSCKQFARQMKDKNCDILTKKPKTVKYKLQMKNRLGLVESWFVVQRIGVLGKGIPDYIKSAIKDGMLGLLPIGGVAVRVPSMSHFQANYSISWLEDQLQRRRKDYKSEKFRAFCFLPLPGTTGIPMHINAHFALDHEARRGLWKEDHGLKSDWNKLLLSTVIGPAYIDALKFIKSVLFFQDKTTQQNRSRTIALESIMLFSGFFPVAKQIQDKDWGHLVKGVCQALSTDLYKLFPVVVKQTHEKNNIYGIDWNAFRQKRHSFPVYFARNDEGFILSDLLLELLTSIGMKITSLSFDVQQSLIDSEIPVNIITPEAVIRYLKCFFRIEDDSVEGSLIPCLVSESQFKTVENINEILTFCSRSNTFDSDLNKLPLLVTNDGMMRCFDENSRAFCTKYFKLVPNSDSKFVHQRQIRTLSVLGRTNFNSVISEFHIQDFAQILHTDLGNHELIRQEIVDVDAIELPFEKNSWLFNLWEYLEEDYKIQKESGDTETFMTFLEQIQHWCFVPTIKGTVCKHLVKIIKIYSVLSVESFASLPPLEAAIRKLEIPFLDKSVLPEKSVHLLSSGLAHAENPVSVLICLNYYRVEIGLKDLSIEDCYSIMEYFSDNLISMQNNDKVNNTWVSDTLRRLPLYITKEGHMVSLEYEDGKVLVLPNEIPKDGLEQWAETTGTMLLGNNARLKKLYEFLGFTYTDKIDVYLEHILSSWSALPDQAVFIHLKYIKDHLLPQRAEFNIKQKRLIQDLQETYLIVDNHVRKKGSAYFSPHNDVFRIMCGKEDFPPEHIWSYEWEHFLELIGVKCQVSGDLFIQFANACASEGRFGISEQSEEKSKVLIDHLLSCYTEFDSNIYTEISNIKFIVPHIVATKYSDVHQQYSQANSFICYNGSVSYKHSQLIWSSMNLLPKWADPTQYQRKKGTLLHVHLEPPLDNIIKHCQNVCDSLKNIFENRRSNSTTSYQWIESLMDELYNSLQSKGLFSDEVKTRLYHTPLVFFPEAKLLVPAHQVIEDMSSDQEIDPYLLKAPVRYGKYFPLFTYLGAEKNPTCKSYIKVIAKIKEEVHDEQLDERYLSEWGAIHMAVDNLLRCLKPSHSNTGHSRDVKIPSDTILYLPNKERKMSPSSELIVADSRLYFERLKEASNLQYFIGLKALDSIYSTSSIKWLPNEIRPQFLSEIVDEEVDTTQMVEVPNSSAACRLESFIQSDFFVTGLLRLLKHFEAEEDTAASYDGSKDILLRIQNTKVKQVKGLKTYLLLNGGRIDSSAEPKDCFIPKPAENVQTTDIQIFLQTKCKSELEFIQSIDTYLIEYAYYVTGYQIPGHLIIKLFQKLKDPTNIDKMLDKLSIRPYDSQEHMNVFVFPQPGTYVPVELHHLLNCEFSDFKPHEYRAIAVELEDAGVMDLDGAQDSYTPVYIYARIERPMPSERHTPYFSQRYEIFTGSEKVVVPAFRIYKFIRHRSDSTSLELVALDVIPETRQEQCLSEILYSVRHTLQEAWKVSEEERRHVIKRLYLRWHPDKNLGNEKFCAKVFQYIKEVISKLEHGIPLDDGDQSQQSRAYPDFTSSSYFEFCERMNTRSRSHRAYAQDFYGGGSSWSQDEFARGQRGFSNSFVHRESQKQEYKDLGEAHRWQWQAKVDVRHASETINYAEGDPSAYNWICYLCHQAAEKSLKAAGFARDANSVDKNNFDPVSLARQLNDRLKLLASELSDLIGDTTKLRYPDVLQRPKIPSSMYTRDQAQQACELARQIIEIVGEEYAL